MAKKDKIENPDNEGRVGGKILTILIVFLIVLMLI